MKKITLTYKLLMAATGLFLCFFLVIHLLGNLQLFLPAAKAREQFNWYSHLLTKNIIISAISYLLYTSILLHTALAIFLTLKKQTANGTKYAYDKRGSASVWYSRQMGLLGTIIFIFLVIHFKNFWYQYKFTNLPLDSKGNKDLYSVVIWAFQDLWYVILYEVALVALAFHLLHGFFSAARTLGMHHPVFTKTIRITGWVFTSIITAGFMAMPLYIYLTSKL